jgi:hypothetical protein
VREKVVQHGQQRVAQSSVPRDISHRLELHLHFAAVVAKIFGSRSDARAAKSASEACAAKKK